MCAAPCKTSEVVRVDVERNLAVDQGRGPGSHAGGKVVVRPAVKSRN